MAAVRLGGDWNKRMRQWELSDVLMGGLIVMIVVAVAASAACVWVWGTVLLGGGAAPTAVAQPPSDVRVAMPTLISPLPTPTAMPTVPPSPTAAPTRTATPLPPTPTQPPATDTPPPSATGVRPTRVVPLTSTPPPSATPTLSPTPTASATSTATATPTRTPVGASVAIDGIDKIQEWVDIRNGGGTGQDLTDWMLVSERGAEECPLPSITLEPGKVLRIWTFAVDAGPDDATCDREKPIWEDDVLDPAVLYDDLGYEVDREPPK